jgi:hypothetical protein
MRKMVMVLSTMLLVAGCAASSTPKYGVEREINKFHKNLVTVKMKGGVIDADDLGTVANAAKFNPVVIRSQDGKIITTVIEFTLEGTGSATGTHAGCLNIRKGSTASFILNNGSDKVVAKAIKGDSDTNVSAPMGTGYATNYDSGIFYITPDQLKRIAYSNTLAVRVEGAAAYQDFPRQPNNHLLENFLPNFKIFYDTEVKPYINNQL